MSVIYFVVPLAILISSGFAIAFIWAARSGQYDDLDTPPQRILFDDEPNLGMMDDNQSSQSETKQSGAKGKRQ